MIRMRPVTNDRQSVSPFASNRTYTIAHATTIGLVAIIAIGGYGLLDRSIASTRAAHAAIERTSDERMLAQRVASLVGQYELGNAAVKHDLHVAINAFEQTHWSLVSGVPREGIASAMHDPQLKGIYFGGNTPLDAAATEFVTRAKRIAAGSSSDSLLGAHTAPLFLAAQGTLDDTLATAMRVRTERADREANAFRTMGGGLCALLLALLVTMNLAVFAPMARRIVRLARDAHELAQVATTDPLTGTLNRRSFQARGAIEIQKARRYQRPLSLLMIDADHLANIEATHGPGGGETVLKALTSSFFAGTRISDLVARVDSEQFAILLPETNRDGAELLAERLRRKISDLSVPIDDQMISCTVSIGVAAAEKDEAFLWPTFKRADEAMYEAKMRGRNRVVVAA